MADEYSVISFTRNLAADDVVCVVEVSLDLVFWSALDAEFVSSVNNGDGTSTEVYRAIEPAATVGRQFMRLSVTQR